MKFRASALVSLAFLYKSYAYDSRGVVTFDDGGNKMSAIRYEGDESNYLTFEEEKKLIDEKFEEAKSKRMYPEMKRLAIYSVDLLQKHNAQEKASALAIMRQANSIESWMVEMLNRLNAERRKVNVQDLCFNAKLMQAALKHSNDMGNNGFTGHEGSNGSSIEDRVRKEGYPGIYAENVARGQRTPDLAMNAFMKSTAHKKNILHDKYKHVGLAWYQVKGEGHYRWTQVFGATRPGVEPCMTGYSVTQPKSGGGGNSSGGSCAGKNKFKTKAKRASQCAKKCKNKGRSSYEYSSKSCYCC